MRNEVAQTILDQLGGNKFIAMTGAHSLCAEPRQLSLKIKGGRKVSAVVIKLEADDTYTMSLYRMVRSPILQCKLVGEFPGLYADQLTEVFENETGLLTSL